MNKSYQDPEVARRYLHYLKSDNACQEQEAVFSALIKRLPKDPHAVLLDAACGSGWLAARLAASYEDPEGFDSSEILVNEAKKNYPALKFALADVQSPLPYAEGQFDAVILNMAAHDIKDLGLALQNLYQVTKAGGKLMFTAANPYYSFPAGVWKRGLLRFLLRMKPKLKLHPYAELARKENRAFSWKGIHSYFYTLPEYLDAAIKAGFILAGFEEITSLNDSSLFDRTFQLRRFPLILFMEFKKPFK